MRILVIGRAKLLLASIIFIAIFIGSGLMHKASAVNGVEPLTRVDTMHKLMGLAVNVDWGEEYLPAMLDILHQENIKATFFVTGRWAIKNSELMKRMEQEGHAVENHGYSHLHPDQATVFDNRREIEQTEREIEKIIGRKTTLYAPPYGEKGINVQKAVNELKYTLILWTLDTIDWRSDSSVEQIVRRIVSPPDSKGIKEKNGAIILMHPKANSVKALPVIISSLKAQGYQITSVNELMKTGKIRQSK